MASSNADCVFGVVRLISSASKTLVKNRAALEFKFLFERRIDRDTDNVGGQHVAGKLHALKGAVDGAGERLSESGLANAGNAFDEQMSAGENTDQREADNVILTANHAAKSLFEFGGFVGNGDSGLGRHCFDSTIRCRWGGVTYVIGPAVSSQPNQDPSLRSGRQDLEPCGMSFFER